MGKAASLTAADEHALTQAILQGQTLAAVSCQYGISPGTVRDIVNRVCRAAAPSLYALQQSVSWKPPLLQQLRCLATGYGFQPGPLARTEAAADERAQLHAQPWWPPGAVEQGAWRSIPCTEGILEIVAIEHDATSIEVPRIPKGTSGRALE
jgi:hypothetical protein